VSYSFEAKLWRWHAETASWVFITLPEDMAFAIRCEAETRGWGSVKVTASIGVTNWQTSLFPHKASNSYLLPVKAAVRKAEGLNDGDIAKVSLTPL
jgi:hypothetical protein